ncbi:tRNA pseudouridine(13) synthase TruD [Candidatus Woesearchaeota archaeon]|nr:tRNA pseudouridine(13) synthase TruD [Candidatus Woesearchaeota archaeon]
MHKIKQIPEDFIVKEVSDIKAGNGQYAYFLLKKINYTTIGALQILSKRFRIPLKNFGFAGNKDKLAKTEQKISIFRGSRNFEHIEFENIELRYLGNGKEPISLGDLEGNEFVITMRNLNNNEIKKIKKLQNKKIIIPNLYGPQRFSKNNHFIGKAIVKREFGKAVDLILENNGAVEEGIGQYLKNNRNNYAGALRLIPLKTRKLLVHSYQSFLFNEIVLQYRKNNKIKKNIKIPIIGFDFELNSIKVKTLKNIMKSILEKEEINPRDFIISQMPELTSEGSFRDLFFQLRFRILEIDDDELNKNKKKAILNFTLPKSCYATVALEFLLR